ncbi:histidine kinase [Cellulosimicrobium arenosum]|uniref:Histidine kinase n=1 Tax=Cellulosimicrobium arenosum TaxID=2708133 RepID=A0A927IZD9_9MICO|nr:histidine kinase [Cellulosimicrobium arenosum]MBD8078458.1 histidine kinase [Cellulosimicrobium arenosum]
MEITRYVDELHRQLATAAAAGGDEARDLAGRLTAPLDAAARLVLLDALSDAAGEISAELAPGSVDVRLRGGSPEFVVTAPAVPADQGDLPAPRAGSVPSPETAPSQVADADADAVSAATTRTTLRLPDHLKSQVEVAAARDGVSVNTWLVRSVSAALEQATGRPAAQDRPAQRSGNRITGWVR